MTCEDLPEDWPTTPLTEPNHLADVLDLFVDRRARLAGSLLILVCDDEHRPVQPLVIEGIDEVPPADSCQLLEPMAVAIGQALPEASVVCAIARRKGSRVTAGDRGWRRCIEDAFAGRTEVLGVHLVTDDGSMPIPPLDPAA